MIDLLEETQRLLSGSDIATSLVDITPERKILAFESGTVVGFVLAYADPATLLQRWRADDSALISQHQLSLRRAQAKAWNAYTVCLAANAASYGELVGLNAIEEDLREEERLEREADRRYWEPLKKELEQLRHRK